MSLVAADGFLGGGSRVDTLSADLEIGGLDAAVLHVTDIAALDDGRFAVLDRLGASVHIFGPDGTSLGRIGRDGRGPGEFDVPLAVAALGTRLVVWDRSPDRAFTVTDTDGHVVGTAGVAIEGDWIALQMRGVRHRFNPPGPEGVEDLTLRLAGLGPNGFLHQTQPDEMLEVRESDRGFPLGAPPTYLVRYDTLGVVVDTLVVSVAPPNLPARVLTPVAGAYTTFQQPIYAARPVWATGGGWVAMGHGDSAAVHVVAVEGDTLLRLEWPRRDAAITEADRFAHAHWRLSEEVDKAGLGNEALLSGSRRGARQQIARDLWPYSDRRPEIMGAFGSRDCLWIAGFAPDDNPWAVSRTWSVINVRTGETEGVFRVPRGGARVREVGPHHVFATYLDAHAVVRMERFPLPELGCSA